LLRPLVMQPIEAPVSNALILVCEKCGKRMDSDFDENPSRRLVSRLKKLAKKRFGRGEVRAVLTSCMDICPDDRVSVALVTFRGAASNTRFFAVKVDDPEETSQRVLREVESDK
jgi:predicted metal-binding protein